MNTMNKIYTFDSTLRDGAQAQGISFTVGDKMKIVKALDELGIDYIEAGNPGSNPKDIEFFQKMAQYKFKYAQPVAFGSTRRANRPVEEDFNANAMLGANTKSVAIFGKSWDLHVDVVLKTSLDENLNMIYDTIKYMKDNSKEVHFDAEHFFDGYKANPEYAMQSLEKAVEAGADWLVLCDTNGGTMPMDIEKLTYEVKNRFDVPVGIHCHNDGGMAVANTIISVNAGARQVQGTMNGYGERCGNANLCSVLPNLQIKMGYKCLEDEKMAELTSVSRYFSEIANKIHDDWQPYVGSNTFGHKGGMHIDAVMKNPATFEHINPDLVGNQRRMLMSEVAGRSTILKYVQKIDPSIDRNSEKTHEIMAKLKEMEHAGYQFEGAESSFELMIRRILGKHRQFFEVHDYRLLCEEHWDTEKSAWVTIKISVEGQEEMTASEGDGPINALDMALRKALIVFYPKLSEVRLTDYKVRVLDTGQATAAKVRVHIESSDGVNTWGTVGVSTNIIEASWDALVDSIEYYLYNYADIE